MAQRTCDQCGATYMAQRKDARFCSRSCGAQSHRRSNSRSCEVAGCTQPHGARGMCYSHYGSWHRRENGRSRNTETFAIVCILCGAEHQSARADGKFCSDVCKGRHYSLTMRRKSPLPADHPVMLLIAEARRPKPKPVPVENRTARQCRGCASWFSPLYRSAASQMMCCSHRCAKRDARRRRRGREHGARGEWTWSEFMKIAAKFDYCCAYCGVKPDRLDADHVVPLSRGGSNAPSNLLPTCLMCNSSKCAMTLSEWSAWLRERGLPSRVTHWHSGDSKYVHLTDALRSLPLAA